MLQNDMICSKWYNLETNAWITSKLGTQHWFVMWNRLRQVFFFKNYQVAAIFLKLYPLLQITLLCNNLKIFVKEIFLNQFRMPIKPCIPSLEVITAIFLKLYHLLQIILSCSILQKTIIFWKRNHSELIQNAKSALFIKFGSYCCNTLEVITFAANILQHFAAT